uniref:Uncharacterized protein n=1 Tax=Compsopogon caeruleus TaxID=31354 RepID=A0A7S1TIP2_9RHOD
MEGDDLPASLRPRDMVVKPPVDKLDGRLAVEEIVVDALERGKSAGSLAAADSILEKKLRNKVLSLDLVRSKGRRSSRSSGGEGGSGDLARGSEKDHRRHQGPSRTPRVHARRAPGPPKIDLSAEERNLTHDGVLPLHTLWNTYAQSLVTDGMEGDNLNATGTPYNKTRHTTTLDDDRLADRVTRMDLHGAQLTIVRARDPTLVGKSGIVYHETANTFRIIAENDTRCTVPKALTTFHLRIGTRQVELFGSTLQLKPSERSVRKFKRKHILTS